MKDFREAIEWVLGEVQRGVSTQRYKGLGEMNPEQLWETTMDPETRRPAQDADRRRDHAEEIFATLMGDQVEPRRNSSRRTRWARGIWIFEAHASDVHHRKRRMLRRVLTVECFVRRDPAVTRPLADRNVLLAKLPS